MISWIKHLGDGPERLAKKLAPIVAEVNELEHDMQALSDGELRALTGELKDRRAKGEELDELLPEAFAAVREATVRSIGDRQFDVQIMGGVVLHRGAVAEMKTGEGKTYAARWRPTSTPSVEMVFTSSRSMTTWRNVTENGWVRYSKNSDFRLES